MKVFERFESLIRKIRTPSKDTEEAEYIEEIIDYCTKYARREWPPEMIPPLLFHLLIRIIDLLKSILFMVGFAYGSIITLMFIRL